MTVIGVSSGLVVPQINTTVAEPWAYTQINVVKLSYVWTIINYSFLSEEFGRSVFSPPFSAAEDETKWQLELYLTQHWDGNKYLSLFLNLNSSNKAEVTARYKLSILNAKNEKVTNFDEASYTFRKRQYKTGYSLFLKRDFLLDDKNELLLDDKLRILCEIGATTDILVTSGPNDTIKFNVAKHQLPNDLELLFESEKFTDVTLSASGNDFRAHRSVLAARSSVFSATFEEDPESNESAFDLIPMEENVFREMLRFIYTDTVENLDNLAGDLLLVADAYDLEKLKIMCEESLFESLSTKNAADVLIIADAGNADQLKEKVLDFISIHAKDVMDTKSFASLTNSHPLLAAQILRGALMSVKMDSETSKLLH